LEHLNTFGDKIVTARDLSFYLKFLQTEATASFLSEYKKTLKVPFSNDLELGDDVCFSILFILLFCLFNRE